jgi:hypothetical protein
MAKVFLELESSAITNLSEEKIQKLESNNIPFEKDDKSIYLISKSAYESGVSVYSREYDKNYNKFCMQIADSTEGSIGLGEGALNNETLKVLYEIFEDSLTFGGDTESLSAEIVFDKEKNTHLFETDIQESEDDYEDDYEIKESSEPKVVPAKEHLEEIEKIKEVCIEMHEKEVAFSDWVDFLKSKGYTVENPTYVSPEIIFDKFTFVISNKENLDDMPSEINFIAGKFAGWIKR